MGMMFGTMWGLGLGAVSFGVPGVLSLLALVSLALMRPAWTPLHAGLFLGTAALADTAVLLTSRGRKPAGRLAALGAGGLLMSIVFGPLAGPGIWAFSAAGRGRIIMRMKGRRMTGYLGAASGRVVITLVLGIVFLLSTFHR